MFHLQLPVRTKQLHKAYVFQVIGNVTCSLRVYLQSDGSLTRRDDNSGGEESASGSDTTSPAHDSSAQPIVDQGRFGGGSGNWNSSGHYGGGGGNGSGSGGGRGFHGPKITKFFNQDGSFQNVTLSFGRNFEVTATNACAQVSLSSVATLEMMN